MPIAQPRRSATALKKASPQSNGRQGAHATRKDKHEVSRPKLKPRQNNSAPGWLGRGNTWDYDGAGRLVGYTAGGCKSVRLCRTSLNHIRDGHVARTLHFRRRRARRRDRRRGKLKFSPRWTWGVPPCGRSKGRPGKTTQNRTIAGYSRVSVRGTSVAPHARDGVLYCAT